MMKDTDTNNDYKYYVSLQIKPGLKSEYEKAFSDLLNSFCTFESQSGMCGESYNGTDEGYELFSVDIESFEIAKDIALKCTLLWNVGVVEISINNIKNENNKNVTIKYSEPTIR